MKAGTQNKVKFIKLERALGIPKYQVAGILESIWSIAAESTKWGDIGRHSNEDIALTIGWDLVDSDRLIDALVTTGWLDRVEGQARLVVHDWEEHCPDYVRKRIKRLLESGEKRPVFKPFWETADNGGQRRPVADNGGLPSQVKPSLATPSPATCLQPESATVENLPSPVIPTTQEQEGSPIGEAAGAANIGGNLVDDFPKPEIHEVEVIQPGDTSDPPKQSADPPKPKEPGKPTWMTPYSEAWFRQYGGEMPFGKFAKALKQLETKHGADAVIEAWPIYLAATESRFASAQSFAAGYGEYAAKRPDGMEPIRAVRQKPRPISAQEAAGRPVRTVEQLVADFTRPIDEPDEDEPRQPYRRRTEPLRLVSGGGW